MPSPPATDAWCRGGTSFQRPVAVAESPCASVDLQAYMDFLRAEQLMSCALNREQAHKYPSDILVQVGQDVPGRR